MVVGLQVLPQRGGHAGGKDVGIIGRHRHHGQHIAGQAIDDDDAGAVVAQPSRGEVLEIAVDGQLQRFAGDVAARIEFAHHLAARRHLHPLRAGIAAQRFVGTALDAVLADAKAREDEQRVLLFLVLGGRRRADIAEQMGEVIGIGIDPAEGAHRAQAGDIGDLDVERGKGRPVEVARHFDGHVARLDGDIGADAQLVFEAQRQHLADLGKDGIEIADLFGDEFEAIIGAVERQWLAAAIDDPAAARRDEAQLDPVFLRCQPVLFAFEDRQIRQPRRQRDADQPHAAAEHERTPGEALLALGLGPHGVPPGPKARRWMRAHSATTSG